MTLDSLSLSLLPSADSSASTSLLSIIYSNGSGSGSGGNPITALQSALTTETKSVALVAADPQNSRDIAAFRAAVAAAKTPAELLANPQARKVLLTANGLGDQTDYAALVTKALLSDTSKTGSLASTLTDTRWLTVAKTYDFANKGLSVLQNPSVLNSLADGYAEVQWRTSLDQSTPGLSNALDFRSRANTITTVDQVLGDSTMRTVVTTALGIPQEIAYQSLEAQEKAISAKLDVTQLQNPTFVDRLTKQYLIQAQSSSTDSSSSSSSSSSGVLSLFA